MNLYTLGLLFNSTLDDILLIRKDRPKMGLTKLNGLGGSVDFEDSSILRAFLREVSEESGLTLTCNDVDPFGTIIRNNTDQIEVFVGRTNEIYKAKTIRSTDGKPIEPVDVFNVSEILTDYAPQCETLLVTLIRIYLNHQSAKVSITLNDC